ncbi:hypothetical protein GCM10010260_42710 [Streptomyces filipinensis]|uniref:Serine/threonine protein kinase n=1 Tax=Streptomyces filipinensis TaxID=66887 RepID=A0A918MCK3_9ACTN|nr:hypothetical protein GCM10010260_42710 [Streptomyces filipinensis]
MRLLALLGVVTAAVVLPLAVASAGQVGEAARHAMAGKPHGTPTAGSKDGAGSRHDEPGPHGDGPGSRGDGAGSADGKLPLPGEAHRLLGLGLATAARCGPQLTSPDGIEAQTCVLTQGKDTWARTYYRNATGKPLDSVLSLMGPGGHTLQMRCVTSTDDEPATCETPREHTKGGPDAYTAVTEFASRGADGTLLLRSGSDSTHFDGNSVTQKGS